MITEKYINYIIIVLISSSAVKILP